jgi:hypothetical protein
MNIALIIFWLCAGLNGAMLALNDISILSWQYWVWMLIPIVTWLCGRFHEEG